MMSLRYLSVVLFFIFGCESKKEGVKVSGQLESVIASESAVLMKFTETGLEPVDTLEINEKKEFELYIDPKEPTFYRLNFFNRQMVNLILDGTEEEVTVKAHGTNPSDEAVVEGAKHTKHLQVIEGLRKDYQQDVNDLQQQQMEAQQAGDEQWLAQIEEDGKALVNKNVNNLKKYMWEIAPSLAVFYGLELLRAEEHLDYYDSMASKMNDELPDHFFTKSLVEKVENAQKLAVGSDAPEIALPNPEGEIITLSSLKGNYVLIDFWAGWCRPCRMENPNVVRVYNQYKDKNFEILGVSLDRNRESWVKAIEQDGLPWKHVSDLKYFNSEAAADYQIQAIPATYLINPQGKIIAKGLRGPTLEAKLKEIFG